MGPACMQKVSWIYVTIRVPCFTLHQMLPELQLLHQPRCMGCKENKIVMYTFGCWVYTGPKDVNTDNSWFKEDFIFHVHLLKKILLPTNFRFISRNFSLIKSFFDWIHIFWEFGILKSSFSMHTERKSRHMNTTK